MNIEYEGLSDTLYVVRAKGATIDTGVIDEFCSLIAKLADQGAEAFLIDLRGARAIGATGLAALIEVYGRLSKQVDLGLVGLCDQDVEMLKRCGIDAALPIYQSQSEALEAKIFSRRELTSTAAILVVPKDHESLGKIVDVPSALLDFGGASVLDRQLWALRRRGCRQVHILTLDRDDAFRESLNRVHPLGMAVSLHTLACSQSAPQEPVELAAGVIRFARQMILPERVLIAIGGPAALHQRPPEGASVVVRERSIAFRALDGLRGTETDRCAPDRNWIGQSVLLKSKTSDVAASEDLAPLISRTFGQLGHSRGLEGPPATEFAEMMKTIVMADVGSTKERPRERTVRPLQWRPRSSQPAGLQYISPDSTVSDEALLTGTVLIGRNCRVERSVVLQRSIVLDGTSIQAGSFFTDMIIGPKGAVPISSGTTDAKQSAEQMPPDFARAHLRRAAFG